MRDPVIQGIVGRLGRMPVPAARRELADMLAVPKRCADADLWADFARSLDFNARLVTALREAGVRLFGTDCEAGEDDGA